MEVSILIYQLHKARGAAQVVDERARISWKATQNFLDKPVSPGASERVAHFSELVWLLPTFSYLYCSRLRKQALGLNIVPLPMPSSYLDTKNGYPETI
jgi:hypothetical protein